MKTAPITVTEIALIGGVLVLGYVGYTAYSKLKNVSASQVLGAASDYVDVRNTAPNSLLGTSQGWFADTVQKGQESGSTTFVGSFLSGLFK